MIKLRPDLLAALNSGPDGLRQALQIAIRLEFATIPPYLYALYSIKPAQNRDIAGLIKSVVVEEMLHLALDCNILNAICGCPRLDCPKLLPNYPGHLPGSVESSLVVGLAPFSKKVLSEVFMVIEQPEYPLGPPFNTPPDDAGEPHITIGQYYAGIKKQIETLGDGIFRGDARRQLTTGLPSLQTVNIENAKTAIAAIDLIVCQGEGTQASPIDPQDKPAHYFRFAEICQGRKLIRNPGLGGPGFLFAGCPIEFDADGVWPALTNPSRDSYKDSKRAQDLNDAFNLTYTNFLDNLQRVFNGEPDRLAVVLSLMQSLKEQAGVMMAVEIGPGRTAGPTFEYISH